MGWLHPTEPSDRALARIDAERTVRS
jgi:hypothetical protein